MYFTYDAGGQRVRKVWEHSSLVEERIYLGGFEIYRKWDGPIGDPGTTLELERQTLHINDGQRRIAMVETKTVDPSGTGTGPLNTPRWRFQLTNHLDSASMELDHEAGVISHEEVHPYGSTAFHTAKSGAEMSAKRYRYSGKERDDETGLYCHEARYYAAWLGRWTAADPLGIAQAGRPDLNLYAYVHGRPSAASDPSGLEDEESDDSNSRPAPLTGKVRQGTTGIYRAEDMEVVRLSEDEVRLFSIPGRKQRDSTSSSSSTSASEEALVAWISKLPLLEGSLAAWDANAANQDDGGGRANFGTTWDTLKSSNQSHKGRV